MTTQIEKQSRSDVANQTAAARLRSLAPSVDIAETGEHFELVADMPGVDESNVEITLEKHLLTIEGHASFDKREGWELQHREYEPVVYRRTFTLSSEVSRDGIDAKVRDGVLTLRLPKAEPARAKKIAVKAG